MPINLCEIIYFDFLELVGFYKHTTHQGSKKNEDPNKVHVIIITSISLYTYRLI